MTTDTSPLALRRQLLIMRASIERAELAHQLAALRTETGLKPSGLFKLLPLAVKAARLGRSAPSLWHLLRWGRGAPWLGSGLTAVLGTLFSAGQFGGRAVVTRKPLLAAVVAGVLGWQLWRAVKTVRDPFKRPG